MPYLDKTSTYDREKGYVDFKCPNCGTPVKVNNDGELYSGRTDVGCPYCKHDLILTTKVEVTYAVITHPARRRRYYGRTKHYTEVGEA